MGFEVVRSKVNSSGICQFTHAPAQAEDFASHCFQIRLYRSEYGTIKTLSDPQIEWIQGAVLHEEKELVRGRIYLDTSHFSEYDLLLQNQLNADYMQICKEIRKIAPCRTLDVNNVLIKQRLDDRSVRLLEMGYKLVF